jgi:cysteinyl-tRNA synthetase
MPIRITNTLTGKKEDFQPLHPGEVRMYSCGPTVYGLTHIGNARPAVFFDVVRRFFEYSGWAVKWVSNFTDVDDKIINRAREEKTTSQTIAEKYTAEYLVDLESIHVRLPTIQPKVTETIPQIIEMIKGLISNHAAYVAEDGEVFFSVRSFSAYGALSGKKIDDLLVGVRIQSDEKKRDPLDFSLWKPQKAADEPAWESPWGKGRPGWHIECSAMATHYLGNTFDIHGGGLDLIHPHHENEIAQSEACTRQVFARYWMHNNLISMNKEKMSKSLGNIFLTRDFVQKYTSETLRYLLLSVHYRSPAEFSEAHIREIQAALHRVYSALRKVETLLGTSEPKELPASTEANTVRGLCKGFETHWREALEDDFNTPKVLSYVFDLVRAFNAYVDKKGFKVSKDAVGLALAFKTEMEKLSGVLGLFGEMPSEYLQTLRSVVLHERGLDAVAITSQIAKRNDARNRKDFAEADSIRDALLRSGIALQDSVAGTDWDVVFHSESIVN